MTDQTPITPEVTSDDKLWVALSFVFAPWLPIITLLMNEKKDRAFIKYHNIPALIWGVFLYIITAISFGILGIVGFVSLYFAYKSYKGEYVNIPVITNFCKNQNWI